MPGELTTSLSISLQARESPIGTRIVLRVYGMQGGRLGSLVVATADLPTPDLPTDPEALVALALAAASHLTYHS